MLQLSNLTAQTVQPGRAITFDKVIRDCGCAECFNDQIPNVATLRVPNAIYNVEFHGNVASATAGDAMQLAIALEGFPLSETAMNSTPSTANVLNNVSAGTWVSTCCQDIKHLSVINTGTVPVTLAPNSSFRIVRVA